jgi:hypothetical protein
MKVFITFAILATVFFYFLLLSMSRELFRPSWEGEVIRIFLYAQICFEHDNYPFPVAPNSKVALSGRLKTRKGTIRPRVRLIDPR